MKVGIIGARIRNTEMDKQKIKFKLVEIMNKLEVTHIVSGGAKKGGDRFAEELAKEFNIGMLIFKPIPTSNRSAAIRALFVRNTDVAKNSDILIASVDPEFDTLEKVLASKRGGTNDTIKKFIKFHGKENIHLV